MSHPSSFRVHVKTGSSESKILDYDSLKNTYSVSLISRPVDDAANKELLKLLSKTFKKRFRIKSGSRSKIKSIELIS